MRFFEANTDFIFWRNESCILEGWSIDRFVLPVLCLVKWLEHWRVLCLSCLYEIEEIFSRVVLLFKTLIWHHYLLGTAPTCSMDSRWSNGGTVSSYWLLHRRDTLFCEIIWCFLCSMWLSKILSFQFFLNQWLGLLLWILNWCKLTSCFELWL